MQQFKRSTCLRLVGLLWFSSRSLSAVAPPPLLPEDGDTFDAYVADQEVFDSNLYRLASIYGDEIATPDAPNARRADRINIVSLGGDGQWLQGRQVFEGNLRIDYNRFDHNTVLDNTSGYGNLSWDWQATSYLSGVLAAEYNHQLANFAETRDLGKDSTDSQHYYGNARYQLGPHWAVYGNLSDSHITHSAPQAEYNDFKLQSGGAGVEYATSAADTFALQYDYSDGKYPPTNVFIVDDKSFTPSFHESLSRAIVKYIFTEKTELDAYVGYRKRNFSTVDIGAFSGDVWRASLTWEPTEKTQIIFAAYRDLRAYLVDESNYFVAKGGSIGPLWNATEKLKINALFSYEDQDYIPLSAQVLANGALTAKVKTEQLNILYTPRSAWLLSLQLNHSSRDANQLFYQFNDNIVILGVLYKIH